MGPVAMVCRHMKGKGRITEREVLTNSLNLKLGIDCNYYTTTA